VRHPRILSVLLVIGVLVLSAFALHAQEVEVTAVPPDPLPEESAEDAAEGIVDFTIEAAEGTVNTLENLIERLLTPPESDLARVLLVIGGVILLIGGWRIYDFVIIVAGFLIGASFAVSLVSPDDTLLVLGALLIGGLIGAGLGLLLYHVAVFLIGAYIGAILTASAAITLDLTPISSLVLLIGAILGGVILLVLSFELLVLLSAIVGAQMLALGLGLGVPWVLLFAVVGIVIQLALMRSLNYSIRRRRSRPLAR